MYVRLREIESPLYLPSLLYIIIWVATIAVSRETRGERKCAMTNREFFSAIASNTELSTEMREFAEAAISKLDAKNAAAKSRVTKADKAVIDRREAVKAALTEKLQTRDELAAIVGCSPAQVNGAMTVLVKEGIAVKEAVKANKTSHMAYRLA